MLVKTKVLIAEENQDFLDKMCSLLAECGFEMVSAPKDGLQLVDRIQTERPGIVLAGGPHPDRTPGNCTDGCIPSRTGCTGCYEADQSAHGRGYTQIHADVHL